MSVCIAVDAWSQKARIAEEGSTISPDLETGFGKTGIRLQDPSYRMCSSSRKTEKWNREPSAKESRNCGTPPTTPVEQPQ